MQEISLVDIKTILMPRQCLAIEQDTPIVAAGGAGRVLRSNLLRRVHLPSGEVVPKGTPVVRSSLSRVCRNGHFLNGAAMTGAERNVLHVDGQRRGRTGDGTQVLAPAVPRPHYTLLRDVPIPNRRRGLQRPSAVLSCHEVCGS